MLPPTLAEAYLRCSRFPFLPFAASRFAKCEVDMFLQALRNAGTSGFQQHKKGVSYNCIVIVVVECCRCFVDFFFGIACSGLRPNVPSIYTEPDTYNLYLFILFPKASLAMPLDIATMLHYWILKTAKYAPTSSWFHSLLIKHVCSRAKVEFNCMRLEQRSYKRMQKVSLRAGHRLVRVHEVFDFFERRSLWYSEQCFGRVRLRS